jgi:chemotaxis protein CheX
MDVEYINPFVEQRNHILTEVLGGVIKRGELYLKSTSMPVRGFAGSGWACRRVKMTGNI